MALRSNGNPPAAEAGRLCGEGAGAAAHLMTILRGTRYPRVRGRFSASSASEWLFCG